MGVLAAKVGVCDGSDWLDGLLQDRVELMGVATNRVKLMGVMKGRFEG